MIKEEKEWIIQCIARLEQKISKGISVESNKIKLEQYKAKFKELEEEL